MFGTGFLGEVFTALNLTDEWKGQFFTPYHIADFMARITGGTDNFENDNRKVTVSDCACGGGCLLIAYANMLKRQNINYQQKIIFFAQDIDPTAAMMCYIQLSVLGCDAIIKIGDSLADPLTANEPVSEKIWRTPMHMCGSIFRILSVPAKADEKENESEKRLCRAKGNGRREFFPELSA